MIRTVLWYTFFWAYMLVSIVLAIPLILFYVLNMSTTRDRYFKSISGCWAVLLIKAAGGKVTVNGLENIPEANNLCFVANHQGGFDIPLIVGYLPRIIGFIAKKELMLIPILNIWMKATGCVFIDRSNKRASVNVINRGAENIKNGHAMVIFPAGTRSRGPVMNPFKSGSLKMPIRAGAVIVPVTIDGSYKLKEERNGLITAGSVKLTIHTPVYAREFQEDETQHLADILQKTIGSALS